MKKKIIGLVAVLGLSATLVGCMEEPEEKKFDNVTQNQQNVSNYQTVIDGSLYFIPHEWQKKDLPQRYASFLKDHPELRVVSVQTDAREETHNGFSGYFIFTEKKGEN
ncbi:hypothetical protein PQE66_gp026 [Bacillus phage PBC2]|uniref:Lipoprotein n=1 Tax=Bacillus phage PBC2 TaxID=1675029 RepID=A0A218KBS2_9CAUD|nr:hypothetical protein PQE66_gp026 [Bacillus phage PBC2]AKQ08341.1 hypothetical protein PBC2_026 [Bacillus phage PBC2]